MRILLAIFRYFPFGGLQKDFLRIAEELIRRGHDVTCFTSAWEGEKPQGLHIVLEPVSASTNHGFAIQFEQKFHSFIRFNHFDRTVTFNRINGADFYFAGDDCYRSLIEKRHNPILYLLPRYRTFMKQEESIFKPREKTKILYIAPPQKADYQRIYHTEEERFFLLPPAGDPRCMRPEPDSELRLRKRKEFNIPDSDFLLIQIANDFACKGTDRVITAFASLPESIRRTTTLLLIGGGTHRKKFEKMAEKSGIADRTLFPGSRTDTDEWLAAADLMVHPARKESAGSVLVEALASGLPVICTEICGFSPLVRNAGCPVLHDPFSQTELNDVLLRLLTDRPSWNALALSVRQSAGKMDLTQRTKHAADILGGTVS